MKDKGYFCPIANNNQLGGGAIGVDFTIVFDETIVIVEIVSVNEAIAIDRAHTDICRLLLINGIAIILYLVFSLTKYSVIFTEVEGDFEKITVNLELSRSLGRSKFGENCAPSECDATINLKEKLSFITAVVDGRSKSRSSKRLEVSTIN